MFLKTRFSSFSHLSIKGKKIILKTLKISQEIEFYTYNNYIMKVLEISLNEIFA